jgi:hypothetical protein
MPPNALWFWEETDEWKGLMLGDVALFFDYLSEKAVTYGFNPQRKREAMRLFRGMAQHVQRKPA